MTDANAYIPSEREAKLARDNLRWAAEGILSALHDDNVSTRLVVADDYNKLIEAVRTRMIFAEQFANGMRKL